MLILEVNTAEEVQKKLVLGDYMTVHVTAGSENQKPAGVAAISGIQTRHEAFFQRIERERAELNTVQLWGAA